MPKRRLFIAIDISTEARQAAAAHIDILRRQWPKCSASWTRPEKLHFTLRFLGDTADEKVPAVLAAMERACRSTSPSTLSVAGTGAFPSGRRARVLWLGATGDTVTMARTKDDLDGQLASVGIEPDDREFRPHLTIARVKDPVGCRDLVAHHLAAGVRSAAFIPDGLVLYESRLERTGSVYTVVGRASFAPPSY